MLTWRAVSVGMYGAWRFARLDRGAMRWFDRSPGAVARSFWAGLVAYPGFLMLLAFQVPPEGWERAGDAPIILVHSIGYVIGWTLFPLALLPFCRWLEREAQFFDFLIAYNWSQVLQTALVLMVTGIVASNLLPPEIAALLDIASFIALLAYEWFIARVALEAGGVVATAVVVLDLVLSEVVRAITESLY